MIQIEHQDGSVWTLNTDIGAHLRASDICDKNSTGGEEVGSYREEYQRGFVNPKLVLQHLNENVSWERLSRYVVQIREADPRPRTLYSAALTWKDYELDSESNPKT